MFNKQILSLFVVLLVILVNFENVYNAAISQTNKGQQKREKLSNHQNDYKRYMKGNIQQKTWLGKLNWSGISIGVGIYLIITFILYLISRFFYRKRKKQEKELALLDKVIGSATEEDKKKKYEEGGKKRREEEERKKREAKRKRKGPTSLQMDSSSIFEGKEINTAIEMNKDEDMEERKFLKEWQIKVKEELMKSLKDYEDPFKTMRNEASQVSSMDSLVLSDSSLASTTQSFSSAAKEKEATKEETTTTTSQSNNQSDGTSVDERSYSSTESESSEALSPENDKD
ncbi:unnamed protein product [Meloidogyne enterolobii]|uniref:Uncharacterized protein n=1 Tax=Meloidogyne enterolobii TaxID=390850 RepID=A0ACB0XL33_MELEN